MKTLSACLLASTSLLLAALPLGAGTIHAWNGPYSVTVDDSSTIFNNGVGFNVGAILTGPVDATGPRNGSTIRTTTSGTVTVTFQADPGYAFSGVDLGFGLFDFYNILGAHGFGHNGSWVVSGGTYNGDYNPPDYGSMTNSAWEGSGDHGSFLWAEWMEWIGGGGQYLPFASKSNPGPLVLLDAVDSFTFSLDYTAWAYDQSHIGVSWLLIDPQIMLAPESPPQSVPDGGIPPLALVTLLAGLWCLRPRGRCANLGA